MALSSVDTSGDPLERPHVARVIMLVAVLISVPAALEVTGSGVRQDLPGVALGSYSLLQIERALVVGAAVAASLIFVVRGWTGYFPSKVTTSGAEYLRRPADHAVLEGEISLHEQLEQMRQLQSSLARNVQRRLDRIESEAATGNHERASSIDPDDML